MSFSPVVVVLCLCIGLRAGTVSDIQDLTGIYVDNGMTTNASGNAPRESVSLCMLISGVIDSEAHRKLANAERKISVVQVEDLVLEIVISGSTLGRCLDTWTKADGMSVDSRGITFQKKAKGSTQTYRLSKGGEQSLIVEIVFVGRDRSGKPFHVTGRYEFPRVPRG